MLNTVNNFSREREREGERERVVDAKRREKKEEEALIG